MLGFTVFSWITVPAYHLSIHLQTPVRGAHLTGEQNGFNKAMSSVRVSVEWLFQLVKICFSFLEKERKRVQLERFTLLLHSCKISTLFFCGNLFSEHLIWSKWIFIYLKNHIILSHIFHFFYNSSCIMAIIILWDFLTFYQIFLLSQMKQAVINKNKNGIHHL